MSFAWHDSNPAWQRYDLETSPDGRTITGITSTNDDDDDGYPDCGEIQMWRVVFRDRAEMIERTSGGSHTGISGIRVTVFLDGVEVTRK